MLTVIEDSETGSNVERCEIMYIWANFWYITRGSYRYRKDLYIVWQITPQGHTMVDMFEGQTNDLPSYVQPSAPILTLEVVPSQYKNFITRGKSKGIYRNCWERT